MTDPIRILLVEDSPGDARLTIEALGQGRTPTVVDVVQDGEAALAFLRREPPFQGSRRPQLVLLDLNLPKRSGHEVLAAVKSSVDLRSIPVIILSTSRNHGDVRSCYESYANAYVAKPVDLDRFMDVAHAIDEFWLSTAVLVGS